MLIKNKLFWVASLVFLALALSIIWLFGPSLLASLKDHRQNIADLDQKITSDESYLSSINNLKNQQTTIDSLYQSAQAALPDQSNADLLVLQLDGLLSNLGLADATINVPFINSSNKSSSNGSSSSDTSGTKPSSMGSGSTTTPPPTVVSGNDNSGQTAFTISGDFNFDKLKSLLSKLGTMVRWNKVTAIEITGSGNKESVTVTAQAFSKSAKPSGFSGSSQLLDNAQKLFSSYQNYSSVPNVSTEGSYGRTDPLSSP